MKVAVVGSRSINSYEVVKAILTQYTFTQVVSGGAKGVDTLAEQYSDEFHLEKPLVILPNWKRYNRGAGAIRNLEIVDKSDFVIAIWDGKSKGTVISINYAKEQHKAVYVWLVEANHFKLIDSHGAA
jgi:predicted Rossmann fold nucleotide-binding protein DprA/Smf involved in DNA uptake